MRQPSHGVMDMAPSAKYSAINPWSTERRARFEFAAS